MLRCLIGPDRRLRTFYDNYDKCGLNCRTVGLSLCYKSVFVCVCLGVIHNFLNQSFFSLCTEIVSVKFVCG